MSDAMIAKIFWIAVVPDGRLGIAMRPRGGEWLEDEVRAWRAAGVDVVVSLLTPAETSELGLGAEEVLCRYAGLGFRSLPIEDRGVPASSDALRRMVEAVCQDLQVGKSVVVHCRQGVGRSAIAVASVLVALGDDPDAALRSVSEARGCPVPDTPEQGAWVRTFAKALAKKAA